MAISVYWQLALNLCYYAKIAVRDDKLLCCDDRRLALLANTGNFVYDVGVGFFSAWYLPLEFSYYSSITVEDGEGQCQTFSNSKEDVRCILSVASTSHDRNSNFFCYSCLHWNNLFVVVDDGLDSKINIVLSLLFNWQLASYFYCGAATLCLLFQQYDGRRYGG